MNNKEFKAIIEKEVYSLQSLLEELNRQHPENSGHIMIHIHVYNSGENGSPNNANNYDVKIEI